MYKYIKSEWIKEKHSTNRMLLILVPLIFVTFSYLMSLMMGRSPNGRSYFISAAYNWYPTMILPLVISLISTNLLFKEKETNINYTKINRLSQRKIFISKIIVASIDYAIISFLSMILIIFVNKFLIGDLIFNKDLLLATSLLFIANLFSIVFYMLIYKKIKRIGIIILSFVLSLVGVVIAQESYWIIFPWSYSIIMMGPSLGIHPNGTLIEKASLFMDKNIISKGVFLSLLIFLILIFISINIFKEDKAYD